ncbi:MAG: AAA domain-containing protein [Gammaproteobacteria bacterium]|nr:AAA domain-containing protein [Gammaproteobacteria bacterium]
MMTPKEIFAALGHDVIGQNRALQEMSVAIYKHLIEHSVGNVLMMGNSGTGKTSIMRAVERFFSQAEGFEKFSTIIRINANLVADLASRGKQSNVVMDRLALQAANILGEQATPEAMRDYIAHSIICVDEVDKIRAVVGGEPNVKGIVAQDSLLTLMENENVHVEMPYFEAGRWHSMTTAINTEHILFVAGGAFEELYDQVYERVTEKSGLNKFWKLMPRADGSLERRFVFHLGEHLSQEDLFKYGMTPQFLSRFDSTVMLGDLSAPDLVRIFQEIPNAIWPVAVNYFKHSGIELTITEEAAMLIADRAAEKNRLGARALRDVFGKIIKRLEFDPLSTDLVREQEGQRVLEITKEVVETG